MSLHELYCEVNARKRRRNKRAMWATLVLPLALALLVHWRW